MSPEAMDSHGGGEYDAPKRRRLRQLFGAFIARHLIRGDDDVAQAQEHSLLVEVAEALTPGLEAEYPAAILRAQSLLASLHDGRLPESIRREAELDDVDPDELRTAILKWVEFIDEGDDKPLESLRLNTEACAYHRDDMSEAAQVDFTAQVSRTELGLIDSLRHSFRKDGRDD